jgi:CRISPR-associated protein Cas6
MDTMFWQQEDSEKTFQVPDDVVDVLFAMDCRRLPVDHAYALSRAIKNALPWLEEEDGVAIHTVHMAGSQNGWERPEHGTDSHLIVSRRTKLTIRVPKERMEALRRDLQGVTLDVAGCPMTVREGRVRPLSKETTIFSRFVAARPDQDEGAFLAGVADELRSMGIQVRKALCGKSTPLSTPAGPLYTRSLLLADLSPEESVRLQRSGLGPHRDMGCGIFIPHKGVDPVRKGG